MNEIENKEVTPSLLRYICPDNWNDQKKEANPIDAEEIVEAIKDGKEVEIINAVIEGPFILKSVNVESEVSIQRTKIRCPLDWSYATFKRVLNFENSIFETDATFKAVTVEKDIFLDNVTFLGIAAFSDITVMGIFYSRSATYKKQGIFTEGDFKKRIELNKSKFEGEADFVSARIGSTADFTGAVFKEGANFGSARIGSAAVFTGAEFKEWANFNSAQIEGAAFFNPSTFEGEANFVTARIGSNAEFTGAVFKEGANFVSARFGSTALFTGAVFKEGASFNRTQIEESAFFDPSTFEGEADFVSARIGSTADFIGAVFKEGANFGSARIGSAAVFTGAEFKERANFNSAQIEGAAFFNPSTFEGEANFGSARIGSNAEFTGAVFKEGASFNRTQIEESAFFDPSTFEGEANFVSARIGSNAEFIGAEFKERAIFNSAQIQRESHFERTIFTNYVRFENTSFETIYFGKPEVQFHAKIDLRGCIYNRIYPIFFWEQLMKHLDPYDRQPFTQLEETFRRAGKNKLADDVYYERKRREHAQKTLRTPGAWLLDQFLRLFTGYGVRLHRLIVFIALILLVGTIIFHFEGAVEPRLDMQPPPHLPYWEAFWVSLNTFLPVEIPSGANWIPSSKIIRVLGIRFTTFATLLKLAGWILVPVGVAGISGILKR